MALQINKGKDHSTRTKALIHDISKGPRTGFNCMIDAELKRILDIYLSSQKPKRMHQYEWVEQKIREQFNLD